MKKEILYLLLGFTFVVFSCKKDREDEIPNVGVYFTIDLNDAPYAPLNAVGGSVNVTGGVRGIVIYRKSQEEYNAFDRNCSYEPLNDCARIETDSTLNTATDPCCGSRFQLTDGFPFKGPAVRPLKAYKTNLDGSKLTVANY